MRLVAAEQPGGLGHDLQRVGLLALQRAEGEGMFRPKDDLLPQVNCALGEIDILPSEPANFGLAHPGFERHGVEGSGLVSGGFGGCEESALLILGPAVPLDLLVPVSRCAGLVVHVLRHVAGHVPVPLGGLEGTADDHVMLFEGRVGERAPALTIVRFEVEGFQFLQPEGAEPRNQMVLDHAAVGVCTCAAEA